MKTFLVILLSISSLSAGEWFGDWYVAESDGFHDVYAVHPFRKIGDKYCDLRPLFKWIDLGQARRSRVKNPMPLWQPVKFKVVQVFDGVLLVTNQAGNGEKHFVFRNHPRQQKLVDGDMFECLAFKLPDRFQYEDVRGSVITVEVYDYGERYDPAERLRQFQAQQKKDSTNNPVAGK